jgi:hypothetical protein
MQDGLSRSCVGKYGSPAALDGNLEAVHRKYLSQDIVIFALRYRALHTTLSREGLLNCRQHSSGKAGWLRFLVETSPHPGRAALVAHECIVSIDLTGKSQPALREICQSLGLSFILY